LPDADECRRRFDRLQPRQRQVIEMVALGWTPKEIAQQIGTTLKTVHNHLNVAAEALDVRPPQPAVTALYHRAMTVEALAEAVPIRRLVESEQRRQARILREREMGRLRKVRSRERLAAREAS
jgi:FixJ family two-component response regulator